MKLLILPLSSLLLVACLSGCKDSIPKCGDDDTIALVKNIVSDLIGESDGMSAAEIKAQMVVEYPRASSFTESIKKYECAAKLVAGGTYQLPITYESQIDDNGQHIVAVDGIGRPDLFQVASAIVDKIKQSHEQAAKSGERAKLATAAPPAQPAALPPPPQPKPAPPPTPASESTPVAAKPSPSNDVPSAVRSFMEKSYGQYDAKHACWKTAYESQAYCMKVVRMDRITADTGERFYLLVGGQPFDEAGEPENVHALSGLAGAFVFEIQATGTELVASNNNIYVGASGSVPEQWDLVKLAKTGYYGWQTTWGDCHQGYCGSRLTILAPYGKSIKDIAAFNVSYSNHAACDNQECPDGKSSIESKVTIDTAAADSEIHPLMVTFKGNVHGQDLSGTSRRLEFDRKAWRYAVPADWPLSDVEY